MAPPSDGRARRRGSAGRSAPTVHTVRVTVCKDRDQADGYVTVAEFSSYERAMANSGAGATQEFAGRMRELCDGPPTFFNLDVIDTFESAG